MSSKIDKSLLNNTNVLPDAALGSRERCDPWRIKFAYGKRTEGVGNGATRGEFNYGSRAPRESGVGSREWAVGSSAIVFTFEM
ncbi:hypothetical protein [Moorena producens]|uniref:hypothetical protein n=1 Tax=Moorena producens TaxID=1155739 RepID=UPI003C7265E1